MNAPAVRAGYSGLPVNLRVQGRRVVVVGAGRIAQRKLEPLLDLGASVLVVAPSVTEEVRAWVDAGRWRTTVVSALAVFGSWPSSTPMTTSWARRWAT